MQPTAFGPLLKRYRMDSGLTQEELADLARLSVRGISDLERGINLKPRLSTVRYLITALQLAPDDRVALQAAARAETASTPLSAGPEPPTLAGGFLGALPPSPLVARQDELSRVLAIADAVMTGESGRLILLAGEPGVGKTRLAQEVAVHLRNRGLLIATGRCYEPEQTVALYPFVEVLRSLYALISDSLKSSIPQRWPYLGHLMFDQALPIPVGYSDDREQQQRLFYAVSGFLTTIAESQPLAILLDDLHWADGSGLALLRHLVRVAPPGRILLFGTYRDVEVGPHHPLEAALLDLYREDLAERVPLRCLTVQDTGNLIAVDLGVPAVSHELAVAVHDRTEGNPFFTREVVRALVERGDIYQQDGQWERRDIEAINVPESVRSVLGQRIGRFSQETQNILSHASVLGESFAFDDLQMMGAGSEEEVEEALLETAAAGLVNHIHDSDYSFSHTLIKDTLYLGLAPRRRRRLHLAAARMLEELPRQRLSRRAGELAWHFLQGDDSERALIYSILAGDQAENVFAHEEAERHYRTALELAREVENSSGEVTALEKLGVVLRSRDKLDEALVLLNRAAELYRRSGDLESVGRVTAHIGRVHQNRGTPTEGIAAIQPVLDELEKHEPMRSLAALYAVLSFLLWVKGSFEEQLIAAERASQLAEAADDKVQSLEAQARRGLALAELGQAESARTVFEEVVSSAEPLGAHEISARALLGLGVHYHYEGQLDLARTHYQRTIETTHKLGAPWAIALINLGDVHLTVGEWAEARKHYQEAEAELGSLNGGWIAPYSLLSLGTLAMYQGQWEDAFRQLCEALTIGQTNEDLQVIRATQAAIAELQILQGQSVGPAERLEPLLDRPGHDERQVTPLLTVLAWAYLASGETQRAWETSCKAVDRARLQQIRIDLVDALRIQGMVLTKQGHSMQARQIFDESLSTARLIPYPYAEARALYQSGIMLGKTGDVKESATRLQAATTIFQRLGAMKDLELAEIALTHLNA